MRVDIPHIFMIHVKSLFGLKRKFLSLHSG
jgi:hypothetical protein